MCAIVFVARTSSDPMTREHTPAEDKYHGTYSSSNISIENDIHVKRTIPTTSSRGARVSNERTIDGLDERPTKPQLCAHSHSLPPTCASQCMEASQGQRVVSLSVSLRYMRGWLAACYNNASSCSACHNNDKSISQPTNQSKCPASKTPHTHQHQTQKIKTMFEQALPSKMHQVKQNTKIAPTNEASQANIQTKKELSTTDASSQTINHARITQSINPAKVADVPTFDRHSRQHPAPLYLRVVQACWQPVSPNNTHSFEGEAPWQCGC